MGAFNLDLDIASDKNSLEPYHFKSRNNIIRNLSTLDFYITTSKIYTRTKMNATMM